MTEQKTSMDISPEPQIDVPVGTNKQAQATSGGNGWHGMSIQDILQKVDLFNFTMLTDEDEAKLQAAKEKLDRPDLQVSNKKIAKSEPKSAFLGPKIWKKPMTLNQLSIGSDDGVTHSKKVDVTGAEFSVMNIDDFLSENNFELGSLSTTSSTEDIYDLESRGQRESIHPTAKVVDYRSRHDSTRSETSDYSIMDMDQTSTPTSPSRPQKHTSTWNKAKNELPKGANSFLYAESKRARLEREKEERRRREEARLEFSAAELALATVPGADFDPTLRHFSMEELRPQPIIRKRKKSYVTIDKKDDKYWEKRNKNNVAARRSREARRLKENQISLRTAFLENENSCLKATFNKASQKHEELQAERDALMEKLKKFETMSPFLSPVTNDSVD